MSNMVVRTNIMALNSHRNLGMVGVQQSRASSRLSSGFRINSAADDAAGLGISEKMRAQIRGLDQASRNGQDGISLIQTAEGAMSTINEMVTRIRELVVQAANDTNAHDQLNSATWSQSDRTRIQDEINQLMAEIDATTKRVEFNTRTLLDGSLAAGTTGGVAGTVFEGFTTGHINFTGLAYPIEPGDVDLEDLVDALNDAIADDEVAFRAILQSGINQTNYAHDVLEDIFAAFGVSTVDWDEDDTQAVISWFNTQRLSLLAAMGPMAGDNEIEVGHLNLQNLTAIDPADIDIEDLVDALNDAGGDDQALAAMRNGINAGNWDVLRENSYIQDIFEAFDITGIDNDDWEDLDEYQLAIIAWFNANGNTFASILEGQPVQTPGEGLWFQVGANGGQGVRLNIDAVDVNRLSQVGTGNLEHSAFTFAALRSNDTSFASAGQGVMRVSGEDINKFLEAIDFAISHVNSQRSNLGAMQNRLEYTIENLDIASENLSAAESRIRDADMAMEMMRLTQANVLQQAATSMLAQANQSPQSILQLLG